MGEGSETTSPLNALKTFNQSARWNRMKVTLFITPDGRYARRPEVTPGFNRIVEDLS
jgi:hypothetical protein